MVVVVVVEVEVGLKTLCAVVVSSSWKFKGVVKVASSVVLNLALSSRLAKVTPLESEG